MEKEGNEFEVLLQVTKEEENYRGLKFAKNVRKTLKNQALNQLGLRRRTSHQYPFQIIQKEKIIIY